jgi:hypothetical protein
MVSQTRSEPVSKALCPVLAFVARMRSCCYVQLHAESGGKNSTEERDVAPEDGAAGAG